MMHSFDVDIASKYGINAAIILNNLAFWIKHNEANETNFYDGKYWAFCSAKAFKELYPYMSEYQIYNSIKKLTDEGIIVKGNYNENQYDRTTWYALSDFGKCILQNREMEDEKTQNRSIENAKSTYKDNKTDRKQDNKKTTKAERFSIFWKAYPKKVGKGSVERWFDRNSPDDSLLKTMLDAIEKAKASAQWQKDNGQYIPLPMTWLNQRRWEDEGVQIGKPTNSRPADGLMDANGEVVWL